MVDELADEVMRRRGAKTRTEAVRLALENELKHADAELIMRERIKRIQERVAADMGPLKVEFDQKAYMDEMWED
jgi:antitoxin VapB